MEALQIEDKYDDALETSKEALKHQDGRLTAVIPHSRLLQLFERYKEALSALETAAKNENPFVFNEASGVLEILGDYKKSLSLLERAYELTAFKEFKFAKHIAARISHLAYLNGDLDKSYSFAQNSDSKPLKKLAEKISESGLVGKRKKLKIGFVRQHNVTCAPATMTMICNYWKRPVDHLDVAEEVCYDGTPAYKERLWAVANGWYAREFKVDWETSKALIDKGIPFTLTTIDPGNGHLQAAIGYDENRKSLLIRDPFVPDLNEFDFEELLKSQKASGPRGMILMPLDFKDRIDGINLSESEVYDALFEVERRLEKHDREGAEQAFRLMLDKYPGHRLSYAAQWSLGSYDSNYSQILEAVNGLMKLFPEDVNLRMAFLSVSDEHMGGNLRLEKLKEFSTAEKTHPLFWEAYAYELAKSGQTEDKALRWLYKATRGYGVNGTNLRGIGNILWARRDFERGYEVYRLSSALGDKDETNAYTFFSAAAYLDKKKEAFEFLSERFERFGKLSAAPAQTLIKAFGYLGERSKGFEVLDRAVAKRPDDGYLLDYGARMHLSIGSFEKAREFADRATPLISKAANHSLQGTIFAQTGNFKRAKEEWLKVLIHEPRSIQAFSDVAWCTSLQEGADAASEFLKKASRKFPKYRPLQELRLEYLQESQTEAIAVTNEIVRNDPNDPWALREMALKYLSVRNLERASEFAERGLKAESNSPVGHYVVGMVHQAKGEITEAHAAFRRSIELDYDYAPSVSALIEYTDGKENKQGILNSIQGFLKSRIGDGYTLDVYASSVNSVFGPTELIERLTELNSIHPESGPLKRLLAKYHALAGDADEALRIAIELTEKEPFDVQYWMNRAETHRQRGESAKELECMERALSLDLNDGNVIFALSDAYLRAERTADAEKIAKEAEVRLPQDIRAPGYLADIAWQEGRREEAIKYLAKAVRMNPLYDWAWRMMIEWSSRPGMDENTPKQLAEKLVEERPNDVDAKIALLRVLNNGRDPDGVIEIADQILKAKPDNIEVLSAKASALADRGSFDDAIRLCETKVFGRNVPELRYRAAFVRYQKGDFQGFENTLKSITKSDPEFFDAWETLAHMYENWQGEDKNYLTAAKKAAEIAPDNPSAQASYADALLRNGKRKTAKRLLKKLTVTNPDFDFATAQLFKLSLEDKETGFAESLLPKLNAFAEATQVLVCEIMLAAEKGDDSELFAKTRKLVDHEHASKLNVDQLAEHFAEPSNGRMTKFIKAVSSLQGLENANPEFCASIIPHVYARQGGKSALALLETTPVDSASRRDCAVGLAIEAGSRKMGPYTKSLIDDHLGLIKQDTKAWGGAGYAFALSDKHKEVIELMSDWRGREGIEQWMLYNYVLALTLNKRTEERSQVVEFALDLPQDHSFVTHLTFALLGKIEDGDFVSASAIHEQLKELQPSDEWVAVLVGLVRQGYKIMEASASGDQSLLKEEIIALGSFTWDIDGFWQERAFLFVFNELKAFALKQEMSGLTKAYVQTRLFLSRHITQ